MTSKPGCNTITARSGSNVVRKRCHTVQRMDDTYERSLFPPNFQMSFNSPPPQTIRDWNALPDSPISSAEGVEDGVAKFSSLVRARD